jgi:hypothetical protein
VKRAAFVGCLLLIAAAGFTPAAANQETRTFTGTITDSECADGYHGRMRMGDTDAECARACIEAHGGGYLLYDGISAYGLSDQQKAAAFAGQRVAVTGTLDAPTRTIAVVSIAAVR